ncbi:hypothetical protein, partial [Klebsiella pneumoniae]|uniref:hypothetical protein n=1 Tax=Klebsiella pneumoniae TaxID=573 RepID=UPI0025A2AE81
SRAIALDYFFMSIWISISSIIIYTNFSTIVLAVLFFNIGSLLFVIYPYLNSLLFRRAIFS